eukprot:CAMPEP_0172747774 /NCGR_PEP_ID=MMETSP1074-20121228/143565_1 /TAXON_ID=2916 /ORGANISM="Ceratium fusus, Strain PA161109" /LENGTH=64 /DNA_ID=CAMNT_0013579371 /DNA_START=88 /DNA_END=282 /DNA_ORIENTATION=+
MPVNDPVAASAHAMPLSFFTLNRVSKCSTTNATMPRHKAMANALGSRMPKAAAAAARPATVAHF